jgi:hypothetical protein
MHDGYELTPKGLIACLLVDLTPGLTIEQAAALAEETIELAWWMVE